MSTQQRALSSVADLMAGLMMVFLFIAIAYMIMVKSSQVALEQEARNALQAKEEAVKALRYAETREKEARKSEEKAKFSEAAAQAARDIAEVERARSDSARKLMGDIASEYVTRQKELEVQLHKEFDADLKRWKAELENGSIRFLEPDILFDTNSAVIKPSFQSVLQEFFPRYVKILTSELFKNEIEEVRIEGHTSSEWRDAQDDADRYLKNAELSQRRAFSVLDYCYSLPSTSENHPWLIKTLRANGLSFASPVTNAQGTIDPARSRRVEFRVITRTSEKIRRILETSGKLPKK